MPRRVRPKHRDSAQRQGIFASGELPDPAPLENAVAHAHRTSGISAPDDPVNDLGGTIA